MKFLISWSIIVSSLIVAFLIVPGIYIEGTNAWIVSRCDGGNFGFGSGILADTVLL